MSAILKQRVRYAPYLKKLRSADDCIPLFKDGQYLGWSGFTGVGAPKVITGSNEEAGTSPLISNMRLISNDKLPPRECPVKRKVARLHDFKCERTSGSICS